MKRLQTYRQAGKPLAERVESRGYTENLTNNFLINSSVGTQNNVSVLTVFKTCFKRCVFFTFVLLRISIFLLHFFY